MNTPLGCSERSKYLVSLLLVAVTVLVYWQAASHGFINFDDPEYLYENTHVKMGITPASIKWAFTTFYASNWHPLTWLSHMADVQFYGMHPSGHHVTSVILHAANAAMLFLLLMRLTGFFWRSMVVAALWALHPLHVESVAWIAERKDVLSAFFWLVTLLLYTEYVKTLGRRWYLAMVAAFAFGLMAKPMLVTLPVVLLLLDYWPLGRWSINGGTIAEGGTSKDPLAGLIPLRKLILEKVPLLVLAAVSSVLTLYAQREGGAINSFENYAISLRIANAITSYAGYLLKMFWPRALAFFYPLPKTFPLVPLLTAVCVFAGMTFLSIRFRRKQPYLAIGWLWYVVTLLPVIGLIQVGGQSSADRYTYLPLIGIFVAMVWWICERTANTPYRRVVLTSASAILLTGCALVTLRQIAYWQNDVTLYTHALAVTDDNYIAHNNLGYALAKEDDLNEASAHFSEAIRIAPRFPDAYVNLGEVLLKTGDIDKSVGLLAKAIELRPNNAIAYLDLGTAMFRKGRVGDALNDFDRALAINPGLGDGNYNKGVVLSKAGRSNEAIEAFTAALDIDPSNPDYHTQLGMELVRTGRFREAITHLSEALRLNPNDTQALQYLNQVNSDAARPTVKQ